MTNSLQNCYHTLPNATFQRTESRGVSLVQTGPTGLYSLKTEMHASRFGSGSQSRRGGSNPDALKKLDRNITEKLHAIQVSAHYMI